MVLYRWLSVAIFLQVVFSRLLKRVGDGAVKAVSDGNCCVYLVGFVKHNVLLLLLLLSCFQAVAGVAQHPK